jgi:hypothetical protein
VNWTSARWKAGCSPHQRTSEHCRTRYEPAAASAPCGATGGPAWLTTLPVRATPDPNRSPSACYIPHRSKAQHHASSRVARPARVGGAATEEAARHSSTIVPADASPRPMDAREVRQALQLIDSAIRHLDVIGQDFAGASSAGAPLNKTLSTRSARRPNLDKFTSPE